MSGLGAWEKLALRTLKVPAGGGRGCSQGCPAPAGVGSTQDHLATHSWPCLTHSILEGLTSQPGAPGAAAVLACPDLGVEGTHVEQHAALLKGQCPLLGWEPRKRVVPRGKGGSGMVPSLSQCPPDWPLPVEDGPQAPGGRAEAGIQEAQLLVVGGQQLQACLIPARGPCGLRAGAPTHTGPGSRALPGL